MAWIKMRSDLYDDPAVVDLMALTGLDEFSVVGRLHMIWAWADSASTDGHVRSVTPTSLVQFLERKVAFAGFVKAMCEVGWMRVGTDRITFPKFDRHMSKSAKNRALTSERQSRNRRDKAVTLESNTCVTTPSRSSVTREEKRRVDKRRGEEPPAEVPSSPAAPALVTEPEGRALAPKESVPRTTWISWYVEAWRGRTGGEMAVEPALKPLSRLIKAHGEDLVRYAFLRWLDETEVKFLSIASFAAKFGQWSGSAAPARVVPQMHRNDALELSYLRRRNSLPKVFDSDDDSETSDDDAVVVA